MCESLRFGQTLDTSHIKAISRAFAEFKSGDTAISESLAYECEQYISLMLDHIYKENKILK
jgi:hemerythrin-like domain-containing protein